MWSMNELFIHNHEINAIFVSENHFLLALQIVYKIQKIYFFLQV